ncbi:MAG: serine/threonine protein kinase [Pseudonocardiales bacterium]|nr:serine/threonine protein kinase [Pseudonocardiales bacterium]MBV9032752.1 serine/threonine protein kinase [Pseudonocardiales bacterium]MBW0010223.1 serine/threonine protein kinase [Pseudonocardiales bacterium]
MGAVTNASPRLVAGRYRLSAVLGRGTMGTVWSAHDEVLGRPVAIKEVLLPPGIPQAEADALRERSLREARAIAALSHPNVVTLYDVAREGAAPFVVMELVASASLAELLRDGALPPRQVVAIGAAVAAALQAAHAAGITHRDVKPGNVLMAHDGRIKLTDFGIARNRGDQTLTATGLMLGSPAYIAPEIASGGPVDPASDLWGLGATLFAAVEGRPPYDAGTAMATVASVVQGEVPRPSCSGALAEVIHGLMVKDPAHRMPLSRVRRLLGAPPEPADPEPVPPPVPVTVAPTPRAGATSAPPDGPEALETPRRRTGQLAADPGPLPFAVPPAAPSEARRPATAHRLGNTRTKGTGAGRRMVLWTLAVLLFLGAATAGFGIVRLAGGRAALPFLGPLPYLGTRAVAGTSLDDVVLTPRVQQVTEPDGTRPARFTVNVPRGWPEFREQRTLGTSSGTVMRFVSPDGSEVVAVERVTGVLPGADVDRYLTAYLRTLAQGVPELVETQRQRLSGDALDATFRTREGGELRRTTYLRLIPTRPYLWAVSVTVPTEREAAGRMKLFEPVVTGFASGL